MCNDQHNLSKSGLEDCKPVPASRSSPGAVHSIVIANLSICMALSFRSVTRLGGYTSLLVAGGISTL